MYKEVGDLPIVPDLVYVLIPARFVPDAIESCGKAGVKRMAIPSGGFNEMGEEGKNSLSWLCRKPDNMAFDL